MINVGAVFNDIAFTVRNKVTGLGQIGEFMSYGICGLSKLIC
jgi:hypothetical protein